jgi:hypothetical protein
MLPSQFVLLDAIPLGANGKVNRNALPAPGASRPALRATYAAPQTPLEQTIAAVWREFLKLDTVGVNDIFFELGGHSLLLVLVHETLQQRLEREVSIADLIIGPASQRQFPWQRRRVVTQSSARRRATSCSQCTRNNAWLPRRNFATDYTDGHG